MILPGTPLREAIRIALDLGLRVENKRRHGEIVFWPPAGQPYVRDARVKDTGKALASFINKHGGAHGSN